jgi:hypothetical protein
MLLGMKRGVFVALLAVLLAGCTSDRTQGTASRARVTAQRERVISCASSNDVFTWDVLRPWVRSMMERVGAPEGWRVAGRRLSDTGTALEVDLPQYERRFTGYVNAEPPDTEHDPKPYLQLIERSGRFTVYSSRSAHTYMFHAESPTLWLSMYAYSTSTRPVLWQPRNAVRTWFRSFRSAARLTPPPVCPLKAA